MEIGKRFAVQIEHIGQCAVHRAAVGDDVAFSKHAEAVDDLLDQVEENRGGQHRHRDLPEPLHGGCPVDGSRFIQRLRDLFEAGKENQHGRAELPYAHQNDDKERGIRVANQRVFLFDAEQAQQAHDNAVIAKDLLPDDRHSDRPADDGRHIVQNPVKRHAHVFLIQKVGHKERKRQPQGHHNKDIGKGDDQRLAKILVRGENFDIIVQPDPVGFREKIVICKRIIDRNDRGDQPHQQKAKQPRRHQKIPCQVVFSAVMPFGLDRNICRRHTANLLVDSENLHRKGKGQRECPFPS